MFKSTTLINDFRCVLDFNVPTINSFSYFGYHFGRLKIKVNST